ncbi:hypothetical protein AKJ16_DCAP02534 [Drosera capensis]
MPFPMKIQPVDFEAEVLRESIPAADVSKQAPKSRLRKLFDRQFPNVLRPSSTDKPTTHGTEKAAATAAAQLLSAKEAAAVPREQLEPSSVCLAKMVQNFLEEGNDKQYNSAVKCGRNRCTCFIGRHESSDDKESDPNLNDSSPNPPVTDATKILESLVACSSAAEWNLLTETSMIIEQNKACKGKHELRKLVTDRLSDSGFDASICRSRWDKSPSFPAGDYEYIDVVFTDGDRLIIDVDFRSEFELARPTNSYKSVLQSLPSIYVGKPDRIKQIVTIVAEAARQSMTKKGLHVPPWRKAEYVRSKWLAPYTRSTSLDHGIGSNGVGSKDVERMKTSSEAAAEETSMPQWELPPAVRARSSERRVTGLAFLLNEKPYKF